MRTLVALGALILLVRPASAQFGIEVPEVVVSWEASIRPAASAPAMTDTFRPGETAFVTLVANVADGWHMYSLDSPSGRPLEVHLDELPRGLALIGRTSETEPGTAYDPGLEEEYHYHDGRSRIWQRISISNQAEEGETVISGSIRYAACREGLCLPVREEPFTARMNVQK